ncbi:MAG: o-succinylbenzoate synthase [Ktedonobacteraceae bacterium]|nr:o-succinylbenzoate synthase [Ktedonobacteraceae bacterium]
MKIKKIVLHKVEIPIVTSFTTSFGTLTNKPTVIVKIETYDGIIGYGEAAAMPFPFYSPDTIDICMLALRDYIAPLVLHKDFPDVQSLMDSLKIIKKHTFAKAGLETAVWMALSIQQDTALKVLLGGTQNKVAVGARIGIKKTIEEILDEIAVKLEEGFQRIKIKIKPGWDITVVEAIRRKFGSILLMVDANSAYTLEDVKLFKALDQYSLTMIEQPLADDDIVDHSVLQKEITTPICLDESILSADDARRAIYLHACKVINIKPGRVGGLLESKKIHDVCQKHAVDVWCGGMFETGIGRAFNIAISSLPNYVYPGDISPINLFYVDDLVKDSFTVDHYGYVKVPEEPGLGFDVDEKKIERYTVEKVTIG